MKFRFCLVVCSAPLNCEGLIPGRRYKHGTPDGVKDSES